MEQLSKRILQTINRRKATWEHLLQQNLYRVSNFDNSEFIPLTMRLTDKQNGSEFGVEEMLEHIQGFPVALVGSPGVGKSTLLLKFAIYLAEQLNDSNAEDALIPVFISAGSMTNYLKEKSDIISWIRLQISNEEREKLLLDGRLCIIIDGLNESSDIDVDNLLRDIYNLYDNFPSCRYIVSCRSLEFPRKWKTRYDLFSVNPVTDQQIREKLENDLKMFKVVDRIFRELEVSNGGYMLDLCRNPLLLTLVVRIIKSELIENPAFSLKELTNKGDVYKRFCECLNTYRIEKLDYKEWGFTPAIEECILSTLAFYMQSTKRVYIRWNDNNSEQVSENHSYSVESLLQKMDYDNDSLCNYVNAVKEQNGEHTWYQNTSSELKKSSYFKLHSIKTNRKQDSMASFIHQSFGEYFAGIYLRNHITNRETLFYLLSPQFEQKKNWDVIEFATCLDDSFIILEEILDYATTYRDSEALQLTSRCLIMNTNDRNVSDARFCKIVDDCCIWLLDAFKNWEIAYNYEMIYAASRLLKYVSEDFPIRLKNDIIYFSEKYSGAYDTSCLPDFFDQQRLMDIASNTSERFDYRADALYTLGVRKWDKDNIVNVRDFLFGILLNTTGEIKEQAMKAIKCLVDPSKKDGNFYLFTDDMFQSIIDIIKNHDESPRIRTYALNTIAETGNVGTINVFMDYLRDKTNPYRDSASWSLQALVMKLSDYSKMANFYYTCLINESNDTTGLYSKGNLVYTLSKIGNPTFVPKLKKWLDNENQPYVIEDGISAIGKLAGLTEIDYISSFINSDDPVIRAKAYESMCALAALSVNDIEKINNDRYSIVRKSIKKSLNASEDSFLLSISIIKLLNLNKGAKKMNNNSDSKVQFQVTGGTFGPMQINLSTNESKIKATQTIKNPGLDVEKLNQLIADIRESLHEGTSDKEAEIVNKNLDDINNELTSGIPKKTVLQKAVDNLRIIKGTAEFLAAVTALIQFIQPMLG